MRFASRIAARFTKKRDWSSLVTRAEAVDAAVHEMYGERGKVAASFLLSLVGWVVGTGEVWLALRLLGHPVGWTESHQLKPGTVVHVNGLAIVIAVADGYGVDGRPDGARRHASGLV